MAEAIAEQRAVPNGDAVLEEATIAFCAVLTNAVEVHDDEGRALGIAVFDPTFSWINHSCSPNACYRFILSSHSDEPELLRIAPHPQVNYSFFFYFVMLLFCFSCPMLRLYLWFCRRVVVGFVLAVMNLPKVVVVVSQFTV